VGKLEDLPAIAGVAGKPIAIAVAFGATLRFLKWLLPFVVDRLDVGRGELAKRLKHVELELDDYRELAMLLISVVAKIDATNPALTLAAERLRKRAPQATLELAELIDQLNAIPGGKA
jgi:hypothetical protein